MHNPTLELLADRLQALTERLEAIEATPTATAEAVATTNRRQDTYAAGLTSIRHELERASVRIHELELNNGQIHSQLVEELQDGRHPATTGDRGALAASYNETATLTDAGRAMLAAETLQRITQQDPFAAQSWRVEAYDPRANIPTPEPLGPEDTDQRYGGPDNPYEGDYENNNQTPEED